MADSKTTRGRNQDRAKVAGGQDHEVKYEAGKTGASKAEIKSTVKSVGNSSQEGRRETDPKVISVSQDAAGHTDSWSMAGRTSHVPSHLR